MKRDFLTHIGKITKLSGTSGELVVFSKLISQLNSGKDDLFFIELQGQFVPFYIEEIKKLGTDRFLIRFENVYTERKASLLLEKNVFIANSKDLKIEDQVTELFGFEVNDINSGFIGKVVDMDMNPKNPILIIQNDRGEILIPFNENIVLGIDASQKIIETEIPEGLLDLYLKDEQ